MLCYFSKVSCDVKARLFGAYRTSSYTVIELYIFD